MAIDRTQFNLLVDDDGTNTKGSAWNKAAISNVILNPVDAAIQQAGINVPFNAADFYGVSAGLVWTVGSPALIASRYLISGKMMYWSIYISWFSGANVLSGTIGAIIGMRIPGGRLAFSGQYLAVAYCQVGGVPVGGGLIASTSGNNTLAISKAVGNFALADVPGFISTFVFEIQ